MVGLEGEDLGLLLADHAEKAVLRQLSVREGRRVMGGEEDHLAFVFGFELLVQLPEAGSTLVVGGRAELHLAGGGDGGVVDVEVQADAGPPTGALDVSADAAVRGTARVVRVQARVHGGGCSQAVGRRGRHGVLRDVEISGQAERGWVAGRP